MIPSWRAAAPALALAALAAGCAAIYFARGILVPFLLAAVIAYTLHPAVAALEHRGMRRAYGVIVVFSAMALAAAGLAAVVIPELVAQVRHFIDRTPEYAQALRAQAAPLEGWLKERYPEQVEALSQQALAAARGALPAAAGWFVAGLQGIVTSVVRLIVAALTIVVIPVFAAYLLIDYRELALAAEAVIPASARAGVERRVAEVDRVLRAWLKGQLIVATTLAVIYAVGLSLLGVPLGILIGLVGGLANMVPYLGLVIGFLPAASLAFLDTGSWGAPLGVAVVFIVGQVLEGTVITPRVVGGEVGLPPALLMLSVLVGGELFGFTGLLLAVPVSAAGLVLLKDLRRSYDASGGMARRAEGRVASRPRGLRRPRAGI